MNDNGTGVFSAPSTPEAEIPAVVFPENAAISIPLHMCEGDDKIGDGAELPRAIGAERAQNITYALTPALLPIGFAWDSEDHQTRTIRRTGAAIPTDIEYTWTATTIADDTRSGGSASIKFKIYVEEHQLPEEPTGLVATKVNSADTAPLSKDKVRLMWDQPIDYSVYSAEEDTSSCIPFPENYVVYVWKLNDLTEQFDEASKHKYSSALDADKKYFSRNDVATKDSDGKDVQTVKNVATDFTVQLPRGIYQFKIAAHNASKLSHNADKTKDVGLSKKSELFAEWTLKDDATEMDIVLKQVVVADPPKTPEDLVESERVSTRERR